MQLRQHNLEQVNQFFATPLARQGLKHVHIDRRSRKKAISTLSGEELAKIAARTHKVQKDLAAGDLGSGTLTLIVIAIAVLIIVLVSKL